MTITTQEKLFKVLITKNFSEVTELLFNKHTRTVVTEVNAEIEEIEDSKDAVVQEEGHHPTMSASHAKRQGIGKENFTHYEDGKYGERKKKDGLHWHDEFTKLARL